MNAFRNLMAAFPVSKVFAGLLAVLTLTFAMVSAARAGGRVGGPATSSVPIERGGTRSIHLTYKGGEAQLTVHTGDVDVSIPGATKVKTATLKNGDRVFSWEAKPKTQYQIDFKHRASPDTLLERTRVKYSTN